MNIFVSGHIVALVSLHVSGFICVVTVGSSTGSSPEQLQWSVSAVCLIGPLPRCPQAAALCSLAYAAILVPGLSGHFDPWAMVYVAILALICGLAVMSSSRPKKRCDKSVSR